MTALYAQDAGKEVDLFSMFIEYHYWQFYLLIVEDTVQKKW